MLLATWKDWTGTRHIYLNLRHDFDIQRISFFHKVSPRDNLDLFMYVVTMEIGNVTEDNVMWLLDFVQRTRVERMKGYLTVYTEVVEERDTFPMLGDDYFKYLNVPGDRTRKPAPLPVYNRHREGKDGQECDHEYDHPSKKFIEKLLQELPLVEYYWKFWWNVDMKFTGRICCIIRAHNIHGCCDEWNEIIMVANIFLREE